MLDDVFVSAWHRDKTGDAEPVDVKTQHSLYTSCIHGASQFRRRMRITCYSYFRNKKPPTLFRI